MQLSLFLRFTAAVSGHPECEGQAERHDGVGPELEQLLGVLGDGADAGPVAAVPASQRDSVYLRSVRAGRRDVRAHVPGVDEAEGEENRAGAQERGLAGERAGEGVLGAAPT